MRGPFSDCGHVTNSLIYFAREPRTFFYLNAPGYRSHPILYHARIEKTVASDT